jgi:hypothetical protein
LTAVGTTDLAGSATDNDALASLTWSLNGSDAVPLAAGDGGAFLVEDIPLLIGPNAFRVTAVDPTGNATVIDEVLTWQPPRTIGLGAADATEGQTVSLPLSLASSGEVGGLTLRLSYDPAYLQEPAVVFSDALEDAFKTANTSTPGEIQLSFALTGGGLPAGGFVFATVGFRARSVPGELASPVTLEILDLADPFGGAFADGNASTDGSVTVSPRGLTGDINANGRLDVGDAYRLQQLLVGNEVTRAWDVGLNDLNGTGSLDAGDLIRVLRAAAEIDPQPGGGGERAAPLRTPLPTELLEFAGLFLLLEGDGAGPGETVTVRVVAGTLDPETAGAKFSISYPTEALRLVDAASHTTGPAVAPGASSLWNVSPGVTDYVNQDGRLTFAGSSQIPWDTTPGAVLAEVVFEVQPGALGNAAWPVLMTAAETPADSGYTTAPVPDQHASFVPDPVGFAEWQAAEFSAGQLADPNVSGFSADPDADGHPNGIEFFAGSDPLRADAGAALEPVVFSDGPQTFLGASFRRGLTTTGLTFDVETATDAAAWDNPDAGSLGAAELVSRTLDPDGLSETVTVRYPEPANGVAVRLLRLLVTNE